jgi:hypothetical protein
MRVDGYWLLCADGTTRPVIPGSVLATDGNWVAVQFLADSAADRTVLIAEVVPRLQLFAETAELALMGVGGRADSVIVQARIRFIREGGRAIFITGSYAAFTDPTAAHEHSRP